MSTIEATSRRVVRQGREPERLAKGVLSSFDIAAATLANIAPAMSFFFGFAAIVMAAGIAAPLTVVVAAVAIALLGNTPSQFSRSSPSTGSFVTFIGPRQLLSAVLTLGGCTSSSPAQSRRPRSRQSSSDSSWCCLW